MDIQEARQRANKVEETINNSLARLRSDIPQGVKFSVFVEEGRTAIGKHTPPRPIVKIELSI